MANPLQKYRDYRQERKYIRSVLDLRSRDFW